MTPRVQPVLMAHPKRRELVDVLRRRVPGLGVSLDVTSLGPWSTARAAWLAGATTTRGACNGGPMQAPTHVLLLQDDALVCDDLLEAVTRMVEARPSSALSLFSPTRLLRHLRATGVMWYASWYRHTGVAHVLPREWVLEMLEWAGAEEPRRIERWKKRSDIRVMEFVREVKRGPFYVPVPNPVNQTGESLLGHVSAGAWRSVVFPGEQARLAGEPWGRLDAHCEICGVVVEKECDHAALYPAEEDASLLAASQ